MTALTWLIPLLPFTGFLITGIYRSRLSEKLTGLIACGTVFLSFVLSLIIFFQIDNQHNKLIMSLFDWIRIPGLTVKAELLVDSLTAVMMLVVTGVGFLIHVYSTGYMHNDEGFGKFFSFMNLFIFFMLVLVMAGNYLIMFIGWEGVGFCSYLLIGFWNRNHEYNNAANKAFIMNRIGDLGFILGMFFIFKTFGSLNFQTVNDGALTLKSGAPVLTVITLLLFAGATGKSAQIPLLTWLPDAMAGPTPVSALIHAATMVTAGVYLVVRSNILFSMAPITMTVIGITGAVTALLAGAIALFQNDIKKILAYSTVSQLGLMFIGLAAGSYNGAIFHLVTHAFFKALLFLVAGSIIHSLAGEQDIRKMGGLRNNLPRTFALALIGALAISGIPPLSGFFSKDDILAAAYSKNTLLWLSGLLVSVMTALYTFRLLWLTFLGNKRSEIPAEKIHESPQSMMIPVAVLGFLATFAGLFFVVARSGSNALYDFLAPVIVSLPGRSVTEVAGAAHNEILLIIITLILILLAIVWTYNQFVRKNNIPAADDAGRRGFVKAAYNKFYIDDIYRAAVIRPLDSVSAYLHDRVDLRIFDAFVEWVGKVVLYAGKNIRRIQNGNVGYYLFAMVIFIIIVLFYSLFR